MEADLQRYYTLDLAEIELGVVDPVRASNLAAHLPPGAACWRVLGTDAAWTQTEHILADIFDRLGSGKKSERYPRPEDAKRRRDHERLAIERAKRRRRRLRRKE